MWENGPATEEYEVVHRGKAQVLSPPKLQAILEADVALGLIETEELIGAKKS